MSRKQYISAADVAVVERNWRGMYVAGAVAALLVLAGTLADIAVAMLPEWEVSTASLTGGAWLLLLQNDPLLGLRNLDLLNAIVSAIGVPLYLALYGAHRRDAPASATLALIVVLAGTVIFLVNNAALPMLELSRGLSAASSDAQRLALEAAASGLLARGAHGSLGAFLGFFLSSLGTLLMGLAMLQGRAFSRASAWAGITGATLMALYTVGITFVPGSVDTMMALVMPGGLLMMVWNVLVAIRLFRLGALRAQARALAPASA